VPPTIDSLTIADDPDSWRAAGFTVDDDGTCRVGLVRIDLVGVEGAAGKRGISNWSVRDLAATSSDGTLDGIPTAPSSRPPADPADHPNGSTRLDHVVITSADGDATAAAFEQAGWALRRVRDADNYAVPMQQRFFRAGEVILELVAPTEPTRDRRTKLFGLAILTDDLDATVASFDGRCNPAKDAVQPGRRIATLRTRDLDVSVPIAFMTPG
jgi:hypothetical protein